MYVYVLGSILSTVSGIYRGFGAYPPWRRGDYCINIVHSFSLM
jgi:hypothetical protein